MTMADLSALNMVTVKTLAAKLRPILDANADRRDSLPVINSRLDDFEIGDIRDLAFILEVVREEGAMDEKEKRRSA